MDVRPVGDEVLVRLYRLARRVLRALRHDVRVVRSIIVPSVKEGDSVRFWAATAAVCEGRELKVQFVVREVALEDLRMDRDAVTPLRVVNDAPKLVDQHGHRSGRWRF